MSSWTMREISILQGLNHPNVIRLHATHIQSPPGLLYMIYDYMDTNARYYMRRHGPFRGLGLRRVMEQIVKAISHCHMHRIFHRDLRPCKILVDEQSLAVKLSGFQTARTFSIPLQNCTRSTTCVWYRAPEVILGQKFGPAIDVWGVGVTAVELATNIPLFASNSEIDTLFKIFRLLGTPNEDTWPGVTNLLYFSREFPQWEDTRLSDLQRTHPTLCDSCLGFARACLVCNPLNRLSTVAMLHHSFVRGTDKCLEIRTLANIICGGWRNDRNFNRSMRLAHQPEALEARFTRRFYLWLRAYAD